MAKCLDTIFNEVGKLPFIVRKVANTTSQSKVIVGSECIITECDFDFRYGGFYRYEMVDGSKNPTKGLDPSSENWELLYSPKRDITTIESIKSESTT